MKLFTLFIASIIAIGTSYASEVPPFQDIPMGCDRYTVMTMEGEEYGYSGPRVKIYLEQVGEVTMVGEGVIVVADRLGRETTITEPCFSREKLQVGQRVVIGTGYTSKEMPPQLRKTIVFHSVKKTVPLSDFIGEETTRTTAALQ